MSGITLKELASCRNKLIVSFLILLLIGLFLSNSWSNESEFNKYLQRESTPFSYALGTAAIDTIVLASVLLACALLASKKPKIAFGLAAVGGAIGIVLSLKDFVSIQSAFVLAKVQIQQGNFAKGGASAHELWTVVLPPTIGCIAVGVFLLYFCLPAVKAARELEVETGSVLASGSYGSIVSTSAKHEQAPVSSTCPTSKEVVCPKCQARILNQVSGPLKCDFCGALVHG